MTLPIDQAEARWRLADLPHPPEIRAILLDDVAFDRRRVVRACDRAGLNVHFTEAATLAEFAAGLDGSPYDLAIIDYRLPDGDGLEALGRLLADPGQSACAAIMIAGEADAAVAVQALKAGCTDYLAKADIAPAPLQRAIGNALEKAGLRREVALALGLHRALRTALDQVSAQAAGEMRAALEQLAAAAGPAGERPARRLGRFLAELAAHTTAPRH